MGEQIESGWYREEGSRIFATSGGIIKDNGRLTPTKHAGGKLIFSNDGCGAKPLVLLGTRAEIFTELDFWKDDSATKKFGIENRLKEYPKIYMTICDYQTKPRFAGLFPVHAAVNALASGALGVFGGGVDAQLATVIGQIVKDVAGGLGDLKDWATQMKSPKNKITSTSKADIEKAKKTNAESKKHGVLYVRFQYDDFEGVQGGCIGSGFVSFSVISKLLEASLGGRPPMQAEVMKKEKD